MTTPYIILSDIHCHNWTAFARHNSEGVNTRLEIILNEMDRAVDVAMSKGVRRGYIAGDLFHVRGSMAPSVLNPLQARIDQHIENGFTWRIEPGNHDLEGKDSDEIGSAVLSLRNSGCDVITDTTYYEDDQVVMIPWRNSLDALRADLAEIAEYHGEDKKMIDVIIHAPLNEVLIGIPDHGLSAEEVAAYGFKRVFCGHYHNFKSFCDGSVFSIGATTHQTWSDIGTHAGFLFVTPTKVVHVKSQAPSFIDYDLSWDEEDRKCVEGNYVRVIVEVDSIEEIAAIRDEIMELGAIDVNIMPIKKSKVTERTSTVAAGASLEVSVGDFVKEKHGDDREIQAFCSEFLTAAKALVE